MLITTHEYLICAPDTFTTVASGLEDGEIAAPTLGR
jgi:hypothetical protein